MSIRYMDRYRTHSAPKKFINKKDWLSEHGVLEETHLRPVIKKWKKNNPGETFSSFLLSHMKKGQEEMKDVIWVIDRLDSSDELLIELERGTRKHRFSPIWYTPVRVALAERIDPNLQDKDNPIHSTILEAMWKDPSAYVARVVARRVGRADCAEKCPTHKNRWVRLALVCRLSLGPVLSHFCKDRSNRVRKEAMERRNLLSLYHTSKYSKLESICLYVYSSERFIPINVPTNDDDEGVNCD